MLAFVLLFALPAVTKSAVDVATLCARRPDADVFFTFDDGPDPQITLPLLDVLARHGARATFFVTGSRARDHPDIVRAVASAGHELAVHGERHLDYANLSAEEIRVDLEVGRQSILAAAPSASILLMRPPHGRWNTRVVAAAEAVGLKPCLWTCSTNDWLHEAVNASIDKISSKVLFHLKRLSRPDAFRYNPDAIETGLVILAHDGLDSKGCCRKGGGVTPAFVDRALDDMRTMQLRAGTCSPDYPAPLSPKVLTGLQQHNSTLADSFSVTFIIRSSGSASLSIALDSLMSQTRPQMWQAIVVSDGPAASRNVSALIASRKRDSRISHVELNSRVDKSPSRSRGSVRAVVPHSGAGDLRNAALPHVRSTWVAFLNDHDSVSPRYVEWIAELAVESNQKNPVDVVIFRMLRRRRSSTVLPRIDAKALCYREVGISFALRTPLLLEERFSNSSQAEYGEFEAGFMRLV